MEMQFGAVSTSHDVVAGPVRGLLGTKPPAIWALPPNTSVYEAVRTMAEKSIGAVLVMEGEALVGIVSERDYARKVMLRGHSSRDTLIKEIMSSPVITVSPSSTIEDCMRLMTEHRVRHLPVVEAGRVIGVLSIGDVVKAIISAQAETIQVLSAYVASSYPA